MTTPGPTTHHVFFATCPRNTEGLLLDELNALGATEARETRSGASFQGTLVDAYRICLWSRVASRVLLRLASTQISAIDDLYEAVNGMPWEDHVSATGTIAVEVTSAIRQGNLGQVNTHFVEQRVKDAIVDRFRSRTGSRPGVDLAHPHIRINVHLAPTEAIISLDLSGDGLHRRGYRTEGGAAPLKENLAAAILLRAGWPALAEQGAPLLDPMCGSGTLLLEGALMAADIAPGLGRDYYGFLGWKQFAPSEWEPLLQEAAVRRSQGLDRLPPLFGYDTEQRAVGTARANARRAGLPGRVLFERRSLSSLTAPAATLPTGLVVTNPPYGKRLGDVSELVPLYETLGEKLKDSFSGWRAAVFTGNPELGAHLGLRAHRTNLLYNGPLPCRLLQFHIGAAFEQSNRSHRRSRFTTGGSAATESAQNAAETVDGSTEVSSSDLSEGARMFANRLVKNSKHLRRWAKREGVHCYRLYDADLPEYSAAIDLYEDWLHVQEYAPPPSVDPVRARRRLKEMMTAGPVALGLPSDHAVLKVRRQQRGNAQYERLSKAGIELEVEEGGLRFIVNLTDYLDTGLFLDHRPTRALIRERSAGRRFLNLFAYTGTATVYAAAGGASSTTTLDLSSTYLTWARRNLEINGLLDARQTFVRADALEWLDAARAASYDLIFMDAPTFSNSKSMTGTLDIQRDHPRLLQAAARLVAPGGTLIFSTNFRHFQLDPKIAQELGAEDMTKQTIPQDFARNPRIHTCFFLQPQAASAPYTTQGRSIGRIDMSEG